MQLSIFIALLIGSPEAATAAQDAVSAAKPAPAKKICRLDETTSTSRMRKKICRTEQEWQEGKQRSNKMDDLRLPDAR